MSQSHRLRSFSDKVVDENNNLSGDFGREYAKGLRSFLLLPTFLHFVKKAAINLIHADKSFITLMLKSHVRYITATQTHNKAR